MKPSGGRVEESIALVRAAVSHAHLLGLDVIAESVETKLQESIALQSGCDVLQGHRFGMPVPAARFDELHSESRLKAA